jgi:hypothetical protein
MLWDMIKERRKFKDIHTGRTQFYETVQDKTMRTFGSMRQGQTV